MKISKELNKFLKENNIKYEIKDGRIYIGCSLYLGSLTSIPKDFNPIVGGNLDLDSLTSIPEGFNPIVGGNLYLNNLTSIPKDFNPTVEYGLYLGSLTSIPKDFNPIVEGYLDLGSLTSIPKDFNPIVGGSLDLRSLTSIPEGFNPIVGGSLYLRSLTSIPEGFNPTVGYSLYLDSLTSIPEDFNPIVRYGLYLDNLTSIPEDFIPTVGGSLYFKNSYKRINYPNINKILNSKLTWQDGKYRVIDDIFCEAITQKRNIIKVKIRNEIAYIFNKDDIYSHGKTIKSAYRDWLFKTNPRDLEEYENLKLDDLKDLNYWVICYRTITGACNFGVENFLEHAKDIKDKMTLEEVFNVTQGQYGYKTFREFFNM